jgi:cysteine-rich repeat protein
VTPVPQDLSAYVLQAYVPDDFAGGFRILDAERTGTSFTIHGVPDGSYDLLVIAPDDPVPHFYQTTARSLDLGIVRLGRVDGPVATLPTELTFHLTGANPGQNDTVFIDSFSTGAETLAFLGGGETSLDPFVLDWRDTAAPLLDAAEGDDLFVCQQRRAPGSSPGSTQRTIVDAFSTHAVTLVNGQPASITGVFAPPSVHGSESVTFSPGSYVQGHDVPVHQPLSMLVRRRAGLTGATSQGSPVADLNQRVNASQQATFGFVDFADPFPVDWPRFVFADPELSWNYAARGTTQVTSYLGNTFSRTPASSFVQFAAPFPAPRAIRVAGADSSQARAVPFDGTHAVTIQWSPVVGVTHYLVTVMQLTSDGIAATLSTIATFDTTTTSAAMPAPLFEVGGSYVFTVATVVDPTTDYAGGVLRRQGFPIWVHEAVTARLLLASSCGNGVVDAPFEDCDSGGIATADCNPDCTRPQCGDGFANRLAHESCDDAGDSVFCNANCTLAACGDGHVHVAGGEQCDDGNNRSFDGCSPDCLVEPGATCVGDPSICHF